jgi:hypothetical protein
MHPTSGDLVLRSRSIKSSVARAATGFFIRRIESVSGRGSMMMMIQVSSRRLESLETKKPRHRAPCCGGVTCNRR